MELFDAKHETVDCFRSSISLGMHEAWRVLKHKEKIQHTWLFEKQTKHRLKPWSSGAEKSLMQAWAAWEKRIQTQQASSDVLQALEEAMQQHGSFLTSSWESQWFSRLSQSLITPLKPILEAWIPWVPPHWIVAPWFYTSETWMLEGWTPWLWIQKTAMSEKTLPDDLVLMYIRPDVYGPGTHQEKKLQWQAMHHCLTEQFPSWKHYRYHRFDLQERMWVHSVFES